MELRVIRDTVKDRGYWADTKALCHPKMLFVILILVSLGHFLAPGDVQLDIYAIGVVGIIFLVLASYRVNELHDGTTATSIPKNHHIIIGVVLFLLGVITSIILAVMVEWWVLILAGIGLALTILYNADVHPLVHNRSVYGLIWGGFPLVFSSMTQAGDPLPSVSVVMFGAWASYVAVYTLWLWGPTTCGRMAVCKRANGQPTDRLCHSPVLKCRERLQMPKEVHNHMKVLMRLNLHSITFLFLAIAAMEWL